MHINLIQLRYFNDHRMACIISCLKQNLPNNLNVTEILLRPPTHSWNDLYCESSIKGADQVFKYKN